jgi:hypothetical protein
MVNSFVDWQQSGAAITTADMGSHEMHLATATAVQMAAPVPGMMATPHMLEVKPYLQEEFEQRPTVRSSHWGLCHWWPGS